MQFESGYQYPSGRIFSLLAVLSVVITLGVWYFQNKSTLEIFSLFVGLEGTALLASAFTPVGLTPPAEQWYKQVCWFLKLQKGVSVQFNQSMFYGGILCLFVSLAIQ